jgi:hypothetical protein
MPVVFPRTQLTRFAVLAATGAAALSVAACGTSNNAPSTTAAGPTSSAAPSSTPSAPGKGKDWVAGQIASVSGDAIQVTEHSGAATVDFSPSTKIVEITPAQLTDVTAGSCVTVRPTRQSADSGTITAQAVRVSSAVDGKCPEPKQPAGTSPTGGPTGHHLIAGTVGSVAGNTITVNGTDTTGTASATSVTVTDTTKYSKQAATDAQALAQGKCVAARGTKDDSGTLQAASISVSPAANGSCAQLGGGHHEH